jgi:hypothetical protein
MRSGGRPRSRGAAAILLMCMVLLVSTCSDASAGASTTGGKDKLTGTVSGVAVHPLFGQLPFTDTTDGQSDGVATKGGGAITFDFSGLGFGIVALKYRYACLTADGNRSIHRFVITESSNEALAPVGTLGLSSVLDGRPDTDQAVFPFHPPAGGPPACSLEEAQIAFSAAHIAFTVTSGNWTVHDGLPGWP